MNQVVQFQPADCKRACKTEWQRNQRRAFREQNGYSTTANYGAGRNRAAVLARDGSKCVKCGMTDAAHKATWNRPITIDHINKNRQDNRLCNLQTLCLRCHGNKDLIPRLRASKAAHKAPEMLSMRAAGKTYQQIADAHGISLSGAYKIINGAAK